MTKNTGDIRFWTAKELTELKQDVLSLLTDKNVKFVPTESDDEQFGALMAYGVAFREVSKLFSKHSL